MSKKNFAKDRVWHVPSSNRISISFARFSVKPCSTNQLYKFIRANQSDTRVRVMWTQQAQNLLIQSPLVIVDSSVCQDLSTIKNNPLLQVLKFKNVHHILIAVTYYCISFLEKLVFLWFLKYE